MSFIARLILRLAGWRVCGEMPEGLKKSVIIMAPHTSNLDFVIGWFGILGLKIKPSLLIKKEAFYFPAGPILKAMGGIPLDRSKSKNDIKYVTNLFEKKEVFHLVITPEGTRKLNRRWKKGFYYVARKAGVPIVLGFMDYGNKTGGIGHIIYPTGNFEEDFKKIEDFYRGKTARHPEQFNLSS